MRPIEERVIYLFTIRKNIDRDDGDRVMTSHAEPTEKSQAEALTEEVPGTCRLFGNVARHCE